MQTHKLVMGNLAGTAVVDKQRKMVVVIDIAIQLKSDIRKEEHWETLEKYQWNTHYARDLQTGRVAQADFKNNIWDLCPEEI